MWTAMHAYRMSRPEMKSQQDIDAGNVKNQVRVEILVFLVHAKSVTVTVSRGNSHPKCHYKWFVIVSSVTVTSVTATN